MNLWLGHEPRAGGFVLVPGLRFVYSVLPPPGLLLLVTVFQGRRATKEEAKADEEKKKVETP